MQTEEEVRADLHNLYEEKRERIKEGKSGEVYDEILDAKMTALKQVLGPS